MSRPAKPRYVCELPEYSVFGPKGIRARNLKKIVMTIDELETIRLIDYQGMTQEQASEQMNVARTTIQRIYVSARKKISESLIDGKILIFEGGEYVLCDENCDDCCKPERFRRKNRHIDEKE